MKKLALIAVALAAALVVAASFALGRAGARLKPVFESKLSEAAANPVRFGKLSFVWSGGPAVVLENLAAGEPASSGEPALRVERVEASLDGGALLSRRIVVRGVTVKRPVLRLERSGGAWRPAGWKTKPVDGGPADGTAGSKPAGWRVDRVRVEDGLVALEETGRPIHEFRDITLEARDLAPGRGASAEFSLSAFSKKKDTEGRVVLDGDFAPQEFEAASEVSLDGEAIERFAPAASAADLGRVSARLRAGGRREGSAWSGTFEVSDGFLETGRIPAAMEGIAAKGTYTAESVNVERFSALIGGGSIEGSAQASLKGGPYSFSGRAAGIPLDALVRQPKERPYLTGNLRADFSGSASSAEAAALAAAGRFSVEGPVVKGVNIVREALNQFASRIPGAGDRVWHRLTDAQRRRLRLNDTPLSRLDASARLESGTVFVDEAVVANEDIGAVAGGRISPDGALDLSARVVASPELSGALAAGVPELRYVMDPYGRVEFPARITGRPGAVRVVPDFENIVSRVAAMKGQELVQKLLEKQLSKGAPAPAPEAAPAAAPAASEPSYGDLLMKLFD